jgi:hypothetical protein
MEGTLDVVKSEKEEGSVSWHGRSCRKYEKN